MGFEPTKHFCLRDFQSRRIGHSRTSPILGHSIARNPIFHKLQVRKGASRTSGECSMGPLTKGYATPRNFGCTRQMPGIALIDSPLVVCYTANVTNFRNFLAVCEASYRGQRRK